MSIEQIVASAGDGKLRDESLCSTELRAFLREAPSEALRASTDYCLANPFTKSGLVLQDVVNEIGRRLDFDVVNGRYSGTSTSIGNDGLWRGPDAHDLVVEVKTTDAYRISLDTIAGYRDGLRERQDLAPSHSMLIVVGRDDTGELEAQVRGSRHAWDMRLISVDALFRLLKIRESTEAPETAAKIRGLLRPAEYTRLDALIDVLFTAAKDVEGQSEEMVDQDREDDSEGTSWEFTAPSVLAEKRLAVIAAVSERYGKTLVQRSRATYWDSEKSLRAVCTLSKRYSREKSVAYWYAYHPNWDEFLAAGTEAVIVFGAMDLTQFFMVPYELLNSRLDELNTTKKAEGGVYWHVKIIEPAPGNFALQMPKTGRHVPLSDYTVELSSKSVT